MEIRELVSLAGEHSRNAGFRTISAGFGDRLMLCVSELSEALEEFRHGHAPNHCYETRDKNGNLKPEGIPSELADCVIRIADIADLYDIDLDAAIVTKMAYNRTRGFRHGGKAI